MMLLQSQDEIEKCKVSTAFSAFYWLAVNNEKVAPKVKLKILTRIVKYAILQKKLLILSRIERNMLNKRKGITGLM